MSKSIKINQNYKYARGVALGSLAMMLAGGMMLLQPFSFSNNANAENSSLDMSVTLSPTISIWTTDTNNNTSAQVDISTNPDETVGTGTIRTHVSTNNLTGYTLTIQSNSNDAKMKHENTSITKTIDPLTGNGTSASSWASDGSLNNMWGYSIGSSDSFKAVPSSTSSATTINSSDAPSLDSYIDTTFGTKVDLNIPAGTYSDTVVFSAVANVVPNSYMQDFTAAQCSILPVWSSADDDITLVDKRDNNSYVIRKLADGNCWMVQNFRMTADTLTAAGHSLTLDSSDTDITSSSSPSTFEMPANQSWSGSATDHLLKGAMSADSPDAVIGSGKSAPVSGEQAVARGAYYTWCTATADCTNDVSTGIRQENSVCPKGWRLADSDGSSSVSTNWYQAIYDAYGSAASFNQAFNTYYSNGSGYYLAGRWWAGSSEEHVDNAGTRGYWWSSTSDSSNASSAWLLYAYTSIVYPADSYSRYFGLSVRCLLDS